MKKKTQTKKKTQMKKTNAENFKEVTHEIEFMFFPDLVSLTIMTCVKLIGTLKTLDNNFRGLLITIDFNSRNTIIQNKLFVLLSRNLHTLERRR